eukprot:jgi/Botrbrau1/9255/Bobra.180_1s0013.1
MPPTGKRQPRPARSRNGSRSAAKASRACRCIKSRTAPAGCGRASRPPWLQQVAVQHTQAVQHSQVQATRTSGSRWRARNKTSSSKRAMAAAGPGTVPRRPPTSCWLAGRPSSSEPLDAPTRSRTTSRGPTPQRRCRSMLPTCPQPPRHRRSWGPLGIAKLAPWSAQTAGGQWAPDQGF